METDLGQVLRQNFRPEKSGERALWVKQLSFLKVVSNRDCAMVYSFTGGYFFGELWCRTILGLQFWFASNLVDRLAVEVLIMSSSGFGLFFCVMKLLLRYITHSIQNNLDVFFPKHFIQFQSWCLNNQGDHQMCVGKCSDCFCLHLIMFSIDSLGPAVFVILRHIQIGSNSYVLHGRKTINRISKSWIIPMVIPTVDGRNPAPPRMYKTLQIMG